MFKNKSILISIIIVGLLGGLVGGYLIINRNNDIYIESYDREDSFHLGSFTTTYLNINVDEHFNEVFFNVMNTKKFLETIKLNPSYQYTYTYTHGSGIVRDVHFFIDNGYGYILYQDSEKFILRPAEAIIDSYPLFLYFPFFVSNYIENSEYISFDSINSTKFNSFGDFEELYSLMSSSVITIDNESEIIRLKGYDYEYQMVRQDKVIELAFDSDGFTVNIYETID